MAISLYFVIPEVSNRESIPLFLQKGWQTKGLTGYSIPLLLDSCFRRNDGFFNSYNSINSWFEIIMKYLKKIRLWTGYLFFLSILFFAKPVILSYWIGLFIVLSGEAIRTWASGCIEKNQNLAKNGPYRLVRNPLYLGSFFIGLGIAIISCSSSFLLAFLLLFLSVYLPTIFREEKFLAGKFTDDYLNYQKTVPPLFPLKLHSHLSPSIKSTFSWQRVKKNREFHTWLALFIILMILGLKIM